VKAALWYRLPAVAYAALLFWASSRPRLPLPEWGLGFEDKLAHFLAFGLLAFLVHRALSKPHTLVSKAALVAGLLSGAYALTDEWHQSFVPGRYFDLWDLAFDVAGIVVVLWVAGRRRPGTPTRAA
jgi:VanZ family protein